MMTELAAPLVERRRSSLAVTSSKPFDANRILTAARASFTAKDQTQEEQAAAITRRGSISAAIKKTGSFYAKHEATHALMELSTNRDKGLTSEEAKKRLEAYGKNELAKEPPTPLWRLFLAQFQDLLVILLIVACFISFGLGEYVPATTIVLIVVANAILGVLMESRAGAAIEALEALTSAMSNVLRDGEIKEVPSWGLVTGDVLILKTGDKIPADVRLIESRNLTTTEASLTGESRPVKKDATAVVIAHAPPVNVMPTVGEEEKVDEGQEKDKEPKEKENTEKESKKKDKKDEKEVPHALTDINMVYMGCEVLEGSGVGVIVKTGMATKMGEVAHLLAAAKSEDSPLQQKLEALGVRLGLASLAISIVVFIIGMTTGRGTDPESPKARWLQMLLIAVSLTVAAVPEGLPACVTITLATGMAHMSKKNAWIRNLHSVETLGSASVICTDKTGTLTAGIQTAVRLWFGNQVYYITGTGYTPVGYFIPSDATSDIARDKDLERKAVISGPWVSVLLGGMLGCGDKTRLQEAKDPKGETFWECTGNSSEKPIVVAAAKAKLTRDSVASSFQAIVENPFDSMRKMMSTLVHVTKKDDSEQYFGDEEYITFVKGAPSVILPKCTHISIPDGNRCGRREITPEDLAGLNNTVDEFGSKTFRVLAICYRTMRESPADDSAAGLETDDLTLLGLIASIDPERPGVAESIEKAADAGVRTIMITGDYIKTAKAIAENIKLLPPDSSEDKSVDCIVLRHLGASENTLSEALEKNKDKEAKSELIKVQAEIDKIVNTADVYARAQPIDKLTIVKSLQRQGHVVAMTGDGVNDAPALRQASIGVAMGKSGTEVARSASDMVLMDDNFVSIVLAIEEGRVIYSNITKFVFYLLSTNIAEVFVILIAVSMGFPSPLKPIQILWLNLITDGLPAIALAVEPPEPRIMEEGPRPKTEGIIEKLMIVGIVFQTIVLTVIVLMVYFSSIYWGTGSWSHERPATMSVGDYELVIKQSTTMCIQCIVFAELLRANTSRSLRLSIFQIGLFTNKWMTYSVVPGWLLTFFVTLTPKVQDVFECALVSDGQRWGLMFGLCALPAFLDECTKFIYRATKFAERPKINRLGTASGARLPSPEKLALETES